MKVDFGDISYLGTPLTAQIMMSAAKNVEVPDSPREGVIRKTLKAISETYRRYWDAIGESGIPARLQ
jgi:hypothetical protein